MPFERLDRLLPHAAVHVLAPQIVHVAVVARVLFDRQFEQRQIARPRFGRVGIVFDANAFVDGKLFPHAVERGQYFVYGVFPCVQFAAVDLVGQEHDALAAVGVKRPGVAIP